MTDNATLLLTLALYLPVLLGAGTLITYGFPLETTLVKRLCARFVLGAAALPTALIALHELAGVRVHPATAFAIGLFGFALLLHDEWRRWQAARELSDGPQADDGSDVQDASGLTDALEDIVLLLLVAGVFLTCFISGTKYPVMEAWDPWGHALGVRYIWDTGSLRQPFADHPVLHYVDAYPPLYDVLMVVPCWLAGSVNAPMKAMNALLVAAAIPALYMLARELSRDRVLAMVATIIYAVLPSNLTRHVWGHSAATVFMLAGLAYAMRARDGWCWTVPGALCFAGTLLAAPTAGIKAGACLLLAAAIIFFIQRRWFVRVVALGTLALAVALIWYLPVFARYGTDLKTLKVAMDGPAARIKTAEALAAGAPEKVPHAQTAFSGATVRSYNFDDFLFFRRYDAIMRYLTGQRIESHIVPTGIGLPVALLALVFLVSCVLRWVRGSERLGWREILLAWLLFSLIGVLGKQTGLVFFMWRFWLLLVPFAVLAAAEGLVFLAGLWRKSTLASVVLLLIGLAVMVNAGAALWYDFCPPAKHPEYSPWPSLDEGYPMAALVLGACLWLGVYLFVLIERANRTAFALVAGIVLLQCVIGAPIRMQKLTHATKDHIMLDQVEYEGYVKTFYQTKPGARIWPMATDQRCQIVVGLDRTCELYRKDECEFFQKLQANPAAVSTSQLVQWLRDHRYEYVVLDPVYQFLLTDGKPTPGNLFEKRVAELNETPGVKQVLELPKAPTWDLSQFHLFRINAVVP